MQRRHLKAAHQIKDMRAGVSMLMTTVRIGRLDAKGGDIGRFAIGNALGPGDLDGRIEVTALFLRPSPGSACEVLKR